MVNPVFRKPTDTNPGNEKVFGTQDVVKMMNVVDGSESGGERIQIDKIEGIDKFAAYAYFVRQTASNTFEAVRPDTGAVQFSGSEFAPVMNSALAALPIPSATRPIGVIYLQGATLDCVTTPVTISQPIIIDGLGSAVVRRNGTYGTPNRAVFRIQSSNVILRNLTVEDFNQDGGANRLITCQPTGTDYTNIIIDNVRIKNAYNPIFLHGVNAGDLIENVIIRNCWVDNVANLGTTQAGPGIVIGMGCKIVTVQNTYMIEPGDTGIEVFATQEFIKLWGNYIFKNVRTAGGGIEVSNIGTSASVVGAPTNSVSIRDNRVYGPILGDGITVTGAAEKIIVANNFVKLGARDGIIVLPRTVSSTDYYPKEVQILGNIVQSIGRTGIYVNTVTSIPFQAFNVSNNYVTETESNAINLDAVIHAVVTGNMVYRYGKDGAADRVGIRIRNATFNTVQANSVFGLTGSSTPVAGTNYSAIAEIDTSNNNIIRGNTMNNKIIMVGANSIISHNNGFRTENANVTSAITGTTLAVNHGLGYTPALKEIFITPTSAWLSMTSFWASNPTSTQFTINCNPAPGGAGTTFAWQIARSY